MIENIKLIRCGGVVNMNDIIRLNEMKVYGVIIGKAFYHFQNTFQNNTDREHNITN